MLWLAEFLLPLQGQQQPTVASGLAKFKLWLAEFLLPLQGQQQHSTFWRLWRMGCD